MSLTPWREFEELFVDPWSHHLQPYWRRRNPWRDDFAFGLHPSDLLSGFSRDFRELDRRPRDLQRKLQGEVAESVPATGKDGFQVSMDVQQFSPEEITVKTNENSIIIEGKHEERQDEHGFVSRHFQRRYILPAGYDANTVTSELSSDGVLTIKAPLPKALEGNERVVSIQQTGPARLSIKDKADKSKL